MIFAVNASVGKCLKTWCEKTGLKNIKKIEFVFENREIVTMKATCNLEKEDFIDLLSMFSENDCLDKENENE